VKPATDALLADYLRQLKLTAALRCYSALARQARESGSEYEDFLLSLLESEMEARADNRLKRRIKDARFPLIKTMEGFDFDATTLDRRLIRELAEGGYIRERRNIIFVGKTGTGKSANFSKSSKASSAFRTVSRRKRAFSSIYPAA